jgi:hypothetical protein
LEKEKRNKSISFKEIKRREGVIQVENVKRHRRILLFWQAGPLASGRSTLSEFFARPGRGNLEVVASGIM